MLTSSVLALLVGGRAVADIDVHVGSGARCKTASIQAAIDAANPSDGVTNILIARNAVYNTNWINITSKNVRLIGGFADCTQSVSDGTKTTINGAGGGQDSVIKVRGKTGVVGFYNLDITGGDALGASAGNHGGGVEIEDGPHALVYFENVWIHDNRARLGGGGLWIKNEYSNSANDVFVWLSHNTRIFSNHSGVTGIAGDGGGIWCSNAKVDMTGGVSDTVGSFVASNTATGSGGGIRAENCLMHIATTSSTTPTISGNTATGPGGGISVSGERAVINLYTLNALAPTMIYNNTSGGVGGGIDMGSGAAVSAWDIILWNNTSRSGGGAVSLFDNDAGGPSQFVMRGTLDGAPHDASSPEGVAVNCAAFHRCNRMSSNAAIQIDGTRRPGAALRGSADGDGYVIGYLAGTEVETNSGENLVEMIGPDVFVHLVGSALFNNTVTKELLHASYAYQRLRVEWTTIAGNSIGGSATFRSSMNGGSDQFYGTQFMNSIHWQPGKKIYSVVDGTVNSLNTDFILSNDLSGIPPSNHNRLVNDPRFENPALADYRLKLDSPAVDYAPSSNGGPTADHMPRLRDLIVVDEFGPQDLGAYERQSEVVKR